MFENRVCPVCNCMICLADPDVQGEYCVCYEVDESMELRPQKPPHSNL